MRKLLRYIFTFALAGILCTCSVVDQGDSEVPVEMNFHIGMDLISPLNGETPNREDIIHSIRIFIFKANGSLEKKAYEATTEPDGFLEIPKKIKILLEEGNKTVCLIANEPASMTSVLDGVRNLHTLEALNLDADHETYNQSSDPLPFTLMQTTRVSSLEPEIELPLERIVGKLRVHIKKSSDNYRTVKLLSTKVINTMNESRLMQGNPLDETLIDLDETTYTTNNTIKTTTTCFIPAIYLYEYVWGKGTVSDACDESTSLVLKLQVRDDNGTPIEQTYIIPLVMQFEEEDRSQPDEKIYTPIYGVARNTVADMYLTVVPEHIKVNYTILDWDTEDLGNRDPLTGNTNMLVSEWESAPAYTVTGSDNIYINGDLRVYWTTISQWNDAIYDHILY